MAQDEALELLERKMRESEKKVLEIYREAFKKDDPIEKIGAVITDMLLETMLTTQELARLINKNRTNASKNVNKLLRDGEVKVIRSEEDERTKRYTITK